MTDCQDASAAAVSAEVRLEVRRERVLERRPPVGEREPHVEQHVGR